MGEVTVGIAPDSWGVWFPDDPRQTPWSRYLDEVASLGFTWTELGPYGYMPTERAELERELDSRNLRLAAGAVMFDLEDRDASARAADEVERVCALVKALGGPHLLIIDDVYTNLFTGESRLPAELDPAGWSRLVQTTVGLCEPAERHGLRAAVHPHAQTHIEYEEQIERLLDDAPPVAL